MPSYLWVPHLQSPSIRTGDPRWLGPGDKECSEKEIKAHLVGISSTVTASEDVCAEQALSGGMAQGKSLGTSRPGFYFLLCGPR